MAPANSVICAAIVAFVTTTPIFLSANSRPVIRPANAPQHYSYRQFVGDLRSQTGLTLKGLEAPSANTRGDISVHLKLDVKSDPKSARSIYPLAQELYTRGILPVGVEVSSEFALSELLKNSEGVDLAFASYQLAELAEALRDLGFNEKSAVLSPSQKSIFTVDRVDPIVRIQLNEAKGEAIQALAYVQIPMSIAEMSSQKIEQILQSLLVPLMVAKLETEDSLNGYVHDLKDNGTILVIKPTKEQQKEGAVPVAVIRITANSEGFNSLNSLDFISSIKPEYEK